MSAARLMCELEKRANQATPPTQVSVYTVGHRTPEAPAVTGTIKRVMVGSNYAEIVTVSGHTFLVNLAHVTHAVLEKSA